MTENLLITSISAKVPLIKAARSALERSAPGGLVFGGDANDTCPGFYFVDRFWKMPPDEQLDLSVLTSFCRDNDIRWIIPTRDGELARFAGWQETAESGLPAILVPPRQAVEICTDKLLFYEKLSDLPEIIPTFERLPSEGSRRWVVKERRGAGSRALCMDLDRERARQAAKVCREAVFQPHIQGREFSVDLYLSRDSQPWGCVVRRRDVVVDGESQVTTTVSHPELERLCLLVAERLKLQGIAVIQALEDELGKLHLLECNCRFGGATTLSVAAGLDVFYWFLRETEDASFRPSGFVRGRPGLRQVRYKCDRIEKIPGAGGQD